MITQWVAYDLLEGENEWDDRIEKYDLESATDLIAVIVEQWRIIRNGSKSNDEPDCQSFLVEEGSELESVPRCSHCAAMDLVSSTKP